MVAGDSGPAGPTGVHITPLSKGTIGSSVHCRRSTVTAGDAFIEDGHHIHLARNEGSTPVELNATFLARPGTTEYLKTEPQPPGCNV